MEHEGEICISSKSSNQSDAEFTHIVGCIENILMKRDFQKKQNDFLEQYWHEFDNSEENKFVYTEIFNKYLLIIERYIEDELLRMVPNFNMVMFEMELRKRQHELDGEIFEVLSTFSNFLDFKDMFLDYKIMKEGKSLDLSLDFQVFKCGSSN